MLRLSTTALIGLTLLGDVLCNPPSAKAVLAEGMTIDQLTNNAQVICAGHATNVHVVAGTPDEKHAALMADFVIDHIIKGVLISTQLTVRLQELPIDKASAVPAPFLQAEREKRWFLFLRGPASASAPYTLVDELRGMILAASRAPLFLPQNNDVAAHLESELLTGLTSDDPQQVDRMMRLVEDWGQRSTNILSTLSRLSSHTNDAIKARAIAARLSHGDLSVLPLVKSCHATEEAMGQLGFALSQVSDPSATPALTDLMRADDAHLRRGATSALRTIADKPGASSKLRGVFKTALDDPDRNIQYDAIMALGQLSFPSHTDLMPARDIFDKDPDAYVTKWKEITQ